MATARLLMKGCKQDQLGFCSAALASAVTLRAGACFITSAEHTGSPHDFVFAAVGVTDADRPTGAVR